MNYLESIIKILNQIENKKSRNNLFIFLDFLTSKLLPSISIENEGDIVLTWRKNNQTNISNNSNVSNNELVIKVKIDRDYVYVISNNNEKREVEQIEMNRKKELLDRVLFFLCSDYFIASDNTKKIKAQSYKDLPRFY